MKRFLGIGLRVLGVALLVYILLFLVQYRDRLRLPDGTFATGRVAEGAAGPVFHEDGSGRVVDLPADWREHDDVQPGLFTIVRESDKLLLLLSVLFFGPITLISITRWWYLLRELGIRVGWWQAFRLTFIGFFFNAVLPGQTGGDVVKAVYISRQATGLRMRAVMSVLVDRVIGVFALGLLAAAVLVPHLDDPQFEKAAIVVFVFLGVAVGFGVVFLSGRVRRVTRLEALIARLPHVVREIDRAVVVYRHHMRAVLLAIAISVVNHLAIGVMSIGLGRAIGIDAATVPTTEFFILVPVCMMMASIPALPGGWGVREAAFVFFFGQVGVLATKAFALSVMIGLAQLGWSLLGGVFFLTQPNRVTKEEVETVAHDVEAAVERSGT